MQLNKPKISIILPVYNGEKYIHQAVQSIIEQSFTNWELLICDDASNDKTFELLEQIAKGDGRIILFKNSINKGKTYSVNTIYKHTLGEYVTIHDADDISHVNRLEKQLNFLEKNIDYVFCGTNFRTVSINGSFLFNSNLKTEHDELIKGLLNESQFHGPTILFRKNVLDSLNQIYRPFFKDYNEDYDLCCRAAIKGKITNISEVLYTYTITPNSLSRVLTVQKKITPKLVPFLFKQRLELGCDSLENEDIELIENMMEELKTAYVKDSSLIYREQASLDLYNKFYLRAIKFAIKSILKKPTVFINYRTLNYVIRKAIFK